MPKRISTSSTSNRSCLLLSVFAGATAAAGATPLPAPGVVDVGCWPATTGDWPAAGSVPVAGGTLMLPAAGAAAGAVVPPPELLEPVVVGGGVVDELSVPPEPLSAAPPLSSAVKSLAPGLSKSMRNGGVRSVPVPGSVPA